MNLSTMVFLILSCVLAFVFTDGGGGVVVVQAIPSSRASTPLTDITVIGTVFCDACSNNTFSRQSYFLKGVKVLIECEFKPSNGLPNEEKISITAERTTDKYGIYKLDIPPVEGFECVEGIEIQSFCHASLIGKSSSSLCSVPGLRTSTGHAAVKSRDAKICFFNLNSLNYRPSKIDITHCGTKRRRRTTSSSDHAEDLMNSALFFWPLPFLPAFGFPWPFSSTSPNNNNNNSPVCFNPFAGFLPPLPPISSIFPPISSLFPPISLPFPFPTSPPHQAVASP